jgi:hypothetical protein
MRFIPALSSVVLATILSGCAVPGLILSMSTTDPAKLNALGKGAPVASVDKALGLTKPLWTHVADFGGTPYEFRLYDSVESARVKVRNKVCQGLKCWSYDEHDIKSAPYAVVYTGKERLMQAWGPLSQLSKSEDPVVVGMLPELAKQYDAYMTARK